MADTNKMRGLTGAALKDAARQNKRGHGSQGGLPGEGVPDAGRDELSKKELAQWIARQEQKALQGGLLRGARGEDGKGGLELVNLLKSNPELAARVRQWMKDNPRQKGLAGMLDDMAGGGRRPALLAAFPELLQQFVAATGKSLIYDAEGNPVRLTGPGGGMREGDTLVEPDLVGANGEVLPKPTFTTTSGIGGFDVLGADTPVAESMLQSRAQKELAQTGGQVFSYEDIVGGEE